MTKSNHFLILFLSILMIGCSSENETNNELTVPVVTTAIISNITQTSAVCGGNITSTGNSEILERGMVWSETETPTVNDFKTSDGNEIGEFVSTLSSLDPNTTYYVRAYATNNEGVAYGEEFSFTTLDVEQVYAIGDLGPGGGYVFEIDSNGIHGKEIAPLSTQFQSQWGCPISNVSGTSSSINSGQSNTELILSYHNAINYYNNPDQCTEVILATGDVAAKNCADLVYNGYSDWYLPSIGELELVLENLVSQGLGDIEGTLLSSSTQSTSSYRKFVVLDTHGNGSTWDLYKYDLTDHRAIRSF